MSSEHCDNELALLRMGFRQACEERDALRSQVRALQAGDNSYQSGYDKGRADGTKARLSELEQERRINAELRAKQAADWFPTIVKDAEQAALEVFSQSCDHTRWAVEYIAAYLLSAAPPPPPPAQQPVAYRRFVPSLPGSSRGAWSYSGPEDFEALGKDCGCFEPLYAAPPAQQQPVTVWDRTLGDALKKSGLGIYIAEGDLAHMIAISEFARIIGSPAQQSQWVPVSVRLPDPDEYPRVLIYTEGSDFQGEQFFDVKANQLDQSNYEAPEDMPEVCQHATHWTPRPAVPGNTAPPEQECGCCGQTGPCDPDCDCAEQDVAKVPRELLERAADRFSKAQIFDFASELRKLLAKEGE